ncbi:MAG: tRNA (guanosine(46)-N7)-methyltransferase TrmB [Ruminococcaceae bacterium]|nr:tRNA (guanosine(46)-N7)-methyltransferase TrmB [Oscillospiraceae bacterium]
MRMRKKVNLIPRMERCSALLENLPEENCGAWLKKFPKFKELRLELGCGKGGFTVKTAKNEPDVLFVAVEKVPEALVVAMERASDEGISNVRFLERDAADLLSYFAPGEVSRIYINFPDPWHKKRAAKRRLTAPGFLSIYEKLLPPGGEIWFKTDNLPLFDWSCEQLEACGWQQKEHTHDLHKNGVCGVMTDYETKFHELGQKINRVVAIKNETDILER